LAEPSRGPGNDDGLAFEVHLVSPARLT
jgi:hypothetical protein